MNLKQFVDNCHYGSLDIKFGHPGWEGENYLETEPYYKWLANYVRSVKPKNILELGRRHGNSLYAMSYFLPFDSTLTSYDIHSCGNVVNQPNVNIRVYDGDFTKFNFSEYDFIFVDINGKGPLEYQIYRQMESQGYKGITAWDDVNSMHCDPREFWDKVEHEKYFINLNNSGSGFGFVNL